MTTEYNWIGIDYGSKLAGTTVICYAQDSGIRFLQSKKKQDADQMILDFVDEYPYDSIFLDAPLSLPLAYFDNGKDYFYRECDRKTGAMSPMFLGGLTARAMRLASLLITTKCYETYPAYLIKTVLQLSELYQKKSKFTGDILDKLYPLLPITLDDEITNWHQFDALLCWISGYRHDSKKALSIGHKDEGLINV